MIKRPSTQSLLAASLKELAKFKSANKITIREITQNCGMTSPTFYNYFHDKYELMAWIYNEKVAESIEHLGKTISFEEVLHKWIEAILEDEEFFLNVLKNAVGQNSFRYTTNDHAINLLSDWIKKYHDMAELPSDIQFHLRFYMRGISEIVNDWCLGKCSYSPQEMIRLFIEAMPNELKPLLLVNITILQYDNIIK